MRYVDARFLTSPMNRTFLVLITSVFLHLSCEAVTFPVSGGEQDGRSIVVSYDSSQKHFGPDAGPDVLLIDRDGKTLAKFPDFSADWSWTGAHPEQAVYRADWSHSGELVYIVYQAGRLFSGFHVYRYSDGALSRVELDPLFSTIQEKELFGADPASPNVARSRVVAWLGAFTLLCAMERADSSYYLAIALPKVGKPRMTHSFELNEQREQP
jgi:hypothetical protein